MIIHLIAGLIKKSFALKSNLAGLKTVVDKLIPVDLSKLSDVVKNDVVKKTLYDKLVATVNKTDSTRFVLKTTYDIDKSDLEKKISDTSDLAKKNTFKC